MVLEIAFVCRLSTTRQLLAALFNDWYGYYRESNGIMIASRSRNLFLAPHPGHLLALNALAHEKRSAALLSAST